MHFSLKPVTGMIYDGQLQHDQVVVEGLAPVDAAEGHYFPNRNY